MPATRGEPTLHGSKAVQDMAYPAKHASDIEDAAPIYHNPVGTSSGYAPVWDGSKYVSTDVLTPAEHTAIGDGAPHHAALTLGANPGLSLSTQELVMGTPSTLTVSTTNAVTGANHTHAITSSANPGAAASILASAPTTGLLTLAALTATTGKFDHIGEATGAHAVVFDNTVTLPTSTLVPDGGTIGQAAGPLVTFDDTNNYLGITGANVGAGTVAPKTNLDARGVMQVRNEADYQASVDTPLVYWGFHNYQDNAGLVKGWSWDVESHAHTSSGGRLTLYEYTGWDSTTPYAVPAANKNLVLSVIRGTLNVGTLLPLSSSKFSVGNAAAANDASANIIAFAGGADATLGPLYGFFGVHPSATRANRYAYLCAYDNAASRTLALNATGAGGFGRVVINGVTASAWLTLGAGSAPAGFAPLKFTSGTLLTTAEAGAVEFLTDDYFATITTGAARKAFVLDDGTRLTATRVPFATTNGRLVDDADLTFSTDTLSATKVAASGGVTTQAVDFTASTPDALGGDVNNWDLGNNTFIRASGGAADRIVTGIVARASGHLLIFQNIGATNKITFANESASSTAANRLINANAGSTEITPNHCIMYIYDATTARWREITHL